MTISFKIRKKCNIGSPRLPIVPIVRPNAKQNVIKPMEFRYLAKRAMLFIFLTQKIASGNETSVEPHFRRIHIREIIVRIRIFYTNQSNE